MSLEAGTPLWSNGFGSVTWVGANQAGVAFLHNGSPTIVGHAPHEAVESWAQRWRDLRAEGLVVCGILEESKGEESR